MQPRAKETLMGIVPAGREVPEIPIDDPRHKAGALLTPARIGQVFYSYSAACQGRLEKLILRRIGWTHIDCQSETGKWITNFLGGNQCKDGRNWEIIELDTAKAIAFRFLEGKDAELQRTLTATQDEMNAVRVTIAKMKEKAD